MTNRDIQKLVTALQKCEKLKQKISTLRDQLRYEWYDIEAILESMDSALDEFDIGKQAMQDGIDRLSQYV